MRNRRRPAGPERIEVLVDVKPDPTGAPAVLVQLPDGFVLIPDPGQAVEIAVKIVQAANELRRRRGHELTCLVKGCEELVEWDGDPFCPDHDWDDYRNG